MNHGAGSGPGVVLGGRPSARRTRGIVPRPRLAAEQAEDEQIPFSSAWSWTGHARHEDADGVGPGLLGNHPKPCVPALALGAQAAFFPPRKISRLLYPQPVLSRFFSTCEIISRLLWK